jgi:hypothetical protein
MSSLLGRSKNKKTTKPVTKLHSSTSSKSALPSHTTSSTTTTTSTTTQVSSKGKTTTLLHSPIYTPTAKRYAQYNRLLQVNEVTIAAQALQQPTSNRHLNQNREQVIPFEPLDDDSFGQYGHIDGNFDDDNNTTTKNQYKSTQHTKTVKNTVAGKKTKKLTMGDEDFDPSDINDDGSHFDHDNYMGDDNYNGNQNDDEEIIDNQSNIINNQYNQQQQQSSHRDGDNSSTNSTKQRKNVEKVTSSNFKNNKNGPNGLIMTGDLDGDPIPTKGTTTTTTTTTNNKSTTNITKQQKNNKNVRSKSFEGDYAPNHDSFNQFLSKKQQNGPIGDQFDQMEQSNYMYNNI